jgi:uncharacterized damage-inducible protein DinB
MNRNDLQSLYEYNRWANARVLKSVSGLSDEQLMRDLAGSYRSVWDTLVHIIWAEWIWLVRWKQIAPKATIDVTALSNLDSVKAKWSEIERDRTEFIERLTDESLENVISYVNAKGETWEYPLAHMMQHVVNHSSYHRGQIATMLRQLGVEPLPTDFLVFFDVGGRVQ